MDSILKSRRRFLQLSGSVLLSSVTNISKASDDCDPFHVFLSQAKLAEENARIWSNANKAYLQSVLEQKIRKLQYRQQLLSEKYNDESVELFLSGLNAIGAIILVGAGIAATTITATSFVFIGGIAFSGSMLVARSFVAPESITVPNIIGEVGLSRLGGLLGTSGDDVFLVSMKAAKLSTAASNALGVLGAIVSIWDALHKGYDLRETIEERRALHDSLKKLLSEKEGFGGEVFRTTCAQGVKYELQEVITSCRSPFG